MPFTLMTDEVLVRESRYSNRFLFWGEAGQFRITNFRLSLSYSRWGSQQEETMPLENLDALQIGIDNKPRLLLAAIIVGFLGFVATVTLIGAIVGIPMLVVAGVILLFWAINRRRTLVLKSGNHEMRLDMKGMEGFADVEQIFNDIEEARVERLKELYA